MLCRVIQAPWRMSTADPKDFFNYDQDLGSWKEYQLRVKQFRVEYSMQEKIQTYEGGSSQAAALDPDLPPELAAAVLAGTAKVGCALQWADESCLPLHGSGSLCQCRDGHGGL